MDPSPQSVSPVTSGNTTPKGGPDPRTVAALPSASPPTVAAASKTVPSSGSAKANNIGGPAAVATSMSSGRKKSVTGKKKGSVVRSGQSGSTQFSGRKMDGSGSGSGADHNTYYFMSPPGWSSFSYVQL